MGALKKLSLEELPQSFSPKSLPEIVNLVKKINEKEAVVYRGKEQKPYLFETSRLIIRRFYPEDTQGVYELAVNRNQSEMKYMDHPWPSDFEGCRAATEWFASTDNMWAVCLKPDFNLIGLIVYNSMDENKQIDLGHVWHTDYWKCGLDTEALGLMVQYAFQRLGAEGVYAYNPLHCEPQIAPLAEIGLEVTHSSEASFTNDDKGNPVTFTGCKMELSKEKWALGYKEEDAPKDFGPREKPFIIYAAEASLSEKIIETYSYEGVFFEVIEKPVTLYAGKTAYASNLTDEPDIPGLLASLQKNKLLDKVVHCVNADWAAAISIDYWQDGAVPRGLMFAKETASREQPEGIDIYEMPRCLYMRVQHSAEAARALGKDTCEIFELFGLIKEKVMPKFGYRFSTCGAQEIEYYNEKQSNSNYAYVPVEKI